MGHSPAAGAVTAALRQRPTLICPISWHSRSVPTITAQPQLSCDRPLWLTATRANTRAQRRLLVLSDWLSIIHPHIPYLEPVQLQRAGGTCEGEDSNVLWYTQWRVKHLLRGSIRKKINFSLNRDIYRPKGRTIAFMTLQLSLLTVETQWIISDTLNR